MLAVQVKVLSGEFLRCDSFNLFTCSLCAKQGPSNLNHKVISQDLSIFGNKYPQNGFKNGVTASKMGLRQPSKGLSWGSFL